MWLDWLGEHLSMNMFPFDVMEIIVVDDHRVYRKSLIEIVIRLFPQSHIQEAENGLEFLKILLNNPLIDLAILDIKMPVMDGIEATRKALTIYPNLKILAISTYDDIHPIQDILDAGALGFLRKGGDRTGIKLAIDSVLAGELFLME